MITKEEYERLRGIDTSMIYADLKKALERKSRSSYELAIPVAAYVLYQMQMNDTKDYSDAEKFQGDFFNEDMGDFNPSYASHHMIEYGYEDEDDGPWKYIVELKGKHSIDELIGDELEYEEK